MCLILLARGQHRRWPLVLLANRDEYVARPSAPMHRWESPAGLIAGRDELAGGTWFGIRPSGHFAAIANLPESPVPDNPPSRGQLLLEYLSDPPESENYLGDLPARAREMAGFNLLFGQAPEAYLFSSAAGGQALGDGVHAVGNVPPGQMLPKLQRARDALSQALRGSPAPEDLRDLMADDEILENTPESAVFIRGKNYATRCTTLLLWSSEKAEVYEWTWPGGKRQFKTLRPPLTRGDSPQSGQGGYW